MARWTPNGVLSLFCTLLATTDFAASTVSKVDEVYGADASAGRQQHANRRQLVRQEGTVVHRSIGGASKPPGKAQVQSKSVRWVFTTDCSAYMFNQGNLLLASAAAVEQPGSFTWIMYGCSRKEQKKAMTKLAHPRATVWHMAETNITDPSTGKPYPHFQASNRPLSLAAWWREAKPSEDQVAILDPDMMFLRAVNLVDHGEQLQDATTGPWNAQAASHGVGAGAMYGQGCVPATWTDEQQRKVCPDREEQCLHVFRKSESCKQKYASGPPWILHRSDVESVLRIWTDTAVRVHQVYPHLLAEQVSYGVSQMQLSVTNTLDRSWFLSAVGDGEQPWAAVAADSYDPCKARAPPNPRRNGLPVLWHACSTYEVPHLKDQGFRLHKDHIQKDLLDCKSPLLHYPPRDALSRYTDRNSEDFREAWSVCTYTNMVNAGATIWKKKFCEKPNLETTFKYPDHSQSFLNAKSWLARVFRKGGWSDIDYKIGD